MKKLSALALIAVLGYGQPRASNLYTATCTLSLSAAAGACTIQQPASDARNVQFYRAYVTSTVDVYLTQERNGAAATATATTRRPVNPDVQDAAKATAFTSSDVGVGTLITAADAVFVPASGDKTLVLEDIQMRGAGTSKNYTVRTSSVTGTVKITISWREY